MKSLSLKLNSYLGYAVIVLLYGIPYGLLKFKTAIAISLVMFASALVTMSFDKSDKFVFLVIGTVMVSMVLAFKYGPLKEGFEGKSPASELTDLFRKMKEVETFSSLEDADEEKPLKEGFRGSGTIEGYEDVKKEKDEKPAPAMKKDEMPMPFKLGEIPSQAKGGPHIDAGSTLMKAIQSLNPDQINAMSKDTQQLIETQKSLMGMLGTMKPMLNDGKELMETFQQMFGQ